MKEVCMQQDDLLGELQVCKQLLNLQSPQEALSDDDDDERQAIANRLAEIETQLALKMEKQES